MIADEFCGKACEELDRGMFGGASKLAEQIKSAERLVLSDAVRDVCYDLAKSRIASIRDAFAMCRVPHKSFWIEWSGRNGEVSSGQFLPQGHGVFLEALDDSGKRFGATFVWKAPKSDQRQFKFTVCPLGYVINWADNWVQSSFYDLANKTTQEARLNPEFKLMAPLERDAAIDLSSKAIVAQNPYCVEMIKRFLKTASFAQQEKMMESLTGDLAGEFRMIVAVLCLINSKNCVERERRQFELQNRKLRKIGRRALLSYSIVNISLSRRDRNEAERAGISEAEIRRHIVRGHFKIRKNGIFWWRPFIRGSEIYGSVIHKHYRIPAQPLPMTEAV